MNSLRVLTLWNIWVIDDDSEEGDDSEEDDGSEEDDHLDEDVNLEKPHYQAATVTRLPKLPRLEGLRVGNDQLTEQDINHLAFLPRLESLDLAGTWVSGADVVQWARLETLERLATNRTTVTARFLESLAALKRLKELRISPYLDTNDRAELTVDKGYPLRFSPSVIDGLRHALATLRQSHPGLIVMNDAGSADEFEEKGESGSPWQWNSQQSVDRFDSFMRQFTLALPGP